MSRSRVNTAAIIETRPISKRLLQKGAVSLTTIELLAMIFNHRDEKSALSIAEKVFQAQQGLQGLALASAADLQSIEELPQDCLRQLLATIELSKRLIVGEPCLQTPILSARDAVRCLGDMAYLKQENVRVLLLDSARRVVAQHTVYVGTVNMSLIRVSEIFREPIIRNCPTIILAHNHPSGDPTPSPEDTEITRAIANAGRLLDIILHDHIILTPERWVSLRELGFSF